MRLVPAVDVRNLVHQPVFLGPLDNLEGFFAGNLAAASGANVVFRRVPHLDAHIFFQVSAAFAHDFAGRAAGAVGHGENIVFVQVLGDFLVVGTAGFAHDRLLDRDDAHQTLAYGEGSCGHGAAHAAVRFHCPADLRVLFDVRVLVDHHFHDAGDPGIVPVLVDAVLLVHETDARVGELVAQPLGVFQRLAAFRRKFFRAHRNAEAHLHRDLGHFGRDDGFEYHVFGVGRKNFALLAPFLSADFIRKIEYRFVYHIHAP
ncbi:MAG: hypothetical protein BWY39_00067 [Spirochaetes bacterium ADurb.Bin269]|nr:MAG: hypothetical protein BWY39_00067 [Spirochaetes bacterium ADurb.Bin269]